MPITETGKPWSVLVSVGHGRHGLILPMFRERLNIGKKAWSRHMVKSSKQDAAVLLSAPRVDKELQQRLVLGSRLRGTPGQRSAVS